MSDTAKALIDEMGGYRKVAVRMGMKTTTLHTHMTSGLLPSKWFDAFCGLARELGLPEPPRKLFSFESLPHPSRPLLLDSLPDADGPDLSTDQENEVSDAA
jgi:hypothetical protein